MYAAKHNVELSNLQAHLSQGYNLALKWPHEIGHYQITLETISNFINPFISDAYGAMSN